jgi:YVTN family beta-propeller protein
MKRVYALCLTLMLIASLVAMAGAQKSATAPPRAATVAARPLVLTETIPLEGVKGRFDHFASGGGQLFVAALGNNSLEVINTGGRALARSIPVPDPQGVAYSPETKKIFVGSGTGKLYIYDLRQVGPAAMTMNVHVVDAWRVKKEMIVEGV